MKKSKSSQKPFYVGLGIIAALGIGTLVWLSARKPETQVVTLDPSVTAATAEGYLLGKPDAPVQVLEFADFECPACSQFATLTEPDVRKRLVEPGLISYRFFDYPLPMHKNTWQASNAAACAAEQGKFWEYHDQLFDSQDRWNGEATSRPKGQFKDIARALALNVDQWEQCFDARKYQRRIQANSLEAQRRNVGQTPTFVIGNRMAPGALSWDHFKALVDTALAAAPKDSSQKGGMSVLADTGAKAASGRK